MKALHFLIAFFLVFVVFHTRAPFAVGKVETYKEISAPEVKDMLEGKKVLAVHVLSEIEYDIQHIPGSVNIPIHKMKTIGKLPKDKNTPLIFYCMGRR
ncbi:MAG: rhodanese-like domain-containing protein [Deltaproteobacteria bacterium]|jgi:rhodanese-related sulfurtransferase|nr:rhodanese-like domain-containing protein [Deltaproteobacteria bacterium]